MIDIKFDVIDRWSKFLGKKINSAIKDGLEQYARELESALYDEAPKNSGALADDIEVERAFQVGIGTLKQTIIFGKNTPYAWAVWKGLDPDIYTVSPRTSRGYMIFPVPERWQQYDGRFGDISYFITRNTLRNNIPANPFIERATERASRRFSFAKYIETKVKR